MKHIISTLWLVLTAGFSYAQYTTTWVGNTFSDVTHYVGNCARSMWVSPEGVVYTASLWDEKGRNIGIYQNGATIGGMGGTKESQGSAIGGNATYIFTAQQAPNSGKIGRYNRSTKLRDLLFTASTGTIDAITGIAVSDGRVYVSDSSGNRVAVFTTGGALIRQWTVTSPGPIAVDSSGAVWVVQLGSGNIRRFDSTGVAGTVLNAGATARLSALYADSARGQLLVGDQGPDMNIKIYTNLTGTPVLNSTFGALGGYLNETGGIRGAAGDKRFTRVVGIGRDASGKLYVLNNPWGGTWDLGRNGATDIHCYSTGGALMWTLQALNFEGNAAADAGTDGELLYSGNIIYSYTGTDGGAYVANTVDPYRYPWDARIQMSDRARGEHFGHLANVGGHRILVANNQNADIFYTYYFNPATDGYIAIPGDTITKVRNGFCLDSLGDIWISQDKTNAIQHYPLTGFAANGKPIWGPVISTPTPASIARLNQLQYIPASDVMVLAGGSTDWTLIGNRIEVYHGWVAGNRTPDTVITLSRAQAKSMSAAGNYLFVGYYAIPDIDVFDLTTGALVLTMNSSNPNVYVGNDVDSQYGIKAYHRSTGEYMITKDDYNANKVVLYLWTPPAAADSSGGSSFTAGKLIPATRGLSVYPNPVVNTLNINIKLTKPTACMISIYDLSGKIVKTTAAKSNGPWNIDVGSLPQSAYILVITDAGNGKMIGQRKFIKQ
ncbi:T9SS type A sorting domain-containing protein [Chitinophaga sp.]|uniref:T9SS type A sorting domain-containing protein n=1 Tax=Chitinophaga sp. TaxID=1869181 RepID=UPI002C7AC129|nr:T9SS type A sorting domain-containing protein [Chitinophaga sp.]HWV65272.1 T9SS type A sorting domain-containing protein [Chitinophaga sp.]